MIEFDRRPGVGFDARQVAVDARQLAVDAR